METIASNPTERAAFLALLDEYFYSRSPTPSTSAYQKPAIVLPTPVAPTPPSSYVPANKSNALAEAVLNRPGVSAALLKKGGIESGQANAMSKFGAKHSEVLAPHLASAATQGVKSGWAARNGGVGESEKVQKGPIMPAGLSSGKKIGSISLNSGPEFRKTLFNQKGPMSKEEAARKKAEIPLPLAVPLARNPSSTSSNTTYTAAQKREQLNAPLLPPPSRAYSVQKTEDEGLGRAKAEFEYASNEADDLPLAEGEVVIVVEHVSSDWWKCRSLQSGREGLVPSNYLSMV